MYRRVITVPNYILEVRRIEADYLTVDHVYLLQFYFSK